MPRDAPIGRGERRDRCPFRLGHQLEVRTEKGRRCDDRLGIGVLVGTIAVHELGRDLERGAGEVAKDTGLREREVEGPSPIDEQAHGLVIATGAVRIGGAPGGLGVRNIGTELVARIAGERARSREPRAREGHDEIGIDAGETRGVDVVQLTHRFRYRAEVPSKRRFGSGAGGVDHQRFVFQHGGLFGGRPRSTFGGL